MPTSIRTGSGSVASAAPHFRSPLPAAAGNYVGGQGGVVAIQDASASRKWRCVGTPQAVALGRAAVEGERIAFSVSPDEWMVLDAPGSVAPPSPAGIRIVEITHLRAALRISGAHAPPLLARLCSLDLTERMFPSGAAARTLVAKVATEIVRDDRDGRSSYLLLVSRSFGRYLFDAVANAAAT